MGEDMSGFCPSTGGGPIPPFMSGSRANHQMEAPYSAPRPSGAHRMYMECHNGNSPHFYGAPGPQGMPFSGPADMRPTMVLPLDSQQHSAPNDVWLMQERAACPPSPMSQGIMSVPQSPMSHPSPMGHPSPMSHASPMGGGCFPPTMTPPPSSPMQNAVVVPVAGQAVMMPV